MFVQRVGAFGRQSPQPRAEILAPSALQIIRIRNFHQVRRPPVQVFWLDDVITLSRFHDRANSNLARRGTLANFSSDLASKDGLSCMNFETLTISVLSNGLFKNAFRLCFDRFPVRHDEPVAV